MVLSHYQTSNRIRRSVARLFTICNFVHNTYNSPNLSNYSPYEVVFVRKPKLPLDLQMDTYIKVLITYKEYYERLEKRLKYLHKVLQDFKTR